MAKDEEDLLSSIERRVRGALAVDKKTAGTMTEGLGKMVSGGLNTAGTVLTTPAKVVGSALSSAVVGGKGAAGALQERANQLAKSTKKVGEGANEAIGNMKDDLSARAQGAATAGVGAARIGKGALNAYGNALLAPARVLGDAVSSAVMGGEGAAGSVKGVFSDLNKNVAEMQRGASDMARGTGEVLAGEREEAKPIASMDRYNEEFVGPQKPRPSISPSQDYGGAGFTDTGNKSPAASAAQAPSSEDRMAAVFRKASGGDFDPKSRMDREKMAQLKSVMDSNPELANASDNKIALAWYKTLEKNKR
jgi:hypothetical protein